MSTRPRPLRLLHLLLGSFLGAPLLALPARAADPFEIQVYDGTANAPGAFGLELHLNHVPSGLKTAEPPLLAPHGQTHFTLEPSFGVTPYWELGAYLQSALRSDGTFDFSGFKLRSKFVTPPGWHPHLRLGLNLEVSRLPERYDPGRWGGELRPIVAWEDERLLLVCNPILGLSFKGEAPALEPAAMVKVRLFGDRLAAGLEYYSELGRLDGLSPFREQQHYIYEAVDLLGLGRLELNLGVGQGLTRGSNPFTVKVIVGWSFEKEK